MDFKDGALSTSTSDSGAGNSAANTIPIISTPTPNPLFNGLVASWKLDEPVGATSFRDSSSVANDGFAVGPNLVFGNAGRGSSTAAQFNNDLNSYGRILAAPKYQLSQVTVTAWIKTTSANGLIVNADIAFDHLFQFRVIGGALQCILFFGPSTTAVTVSSVSPVNDGVWHHVGCGYDLNNINLYVDGAVNTYVPETREMTLARPQILLGRYYGSALPYTGLLSDVNIWSRGLTPAEIAAVFAL